MDAVLRAAAIYLFLLIILRISGKRTLAQITTFDFVLLLVVGEATQQGLIGDDFSVTKAMLLIVSLIGIDIAFSLMQGRLPWLERFVEGLPVIVVEDGSPLDERLKRARVSEDDVLEAGRMVHGLERMDQIKYAVIERDGSISVIPKADADWRDERAGPRG